MRRQAFTQAIETHNIPLTRARDVAPVIAHAAQELSIHKLPALFQFNDYQQKLYTGLQISKDPGANLIWVGSIFLVVGLMMVYVSEYRIWLTIDQQSKPSHLRLVLSGSRKTSINQQYLINRLIRKFQTKGFIVIGDTK